VREDLLIGVREDQSSGKLKQRENDLMLQKLQMMGFDRDVAIFALAQVQYKSAAEAVSFMTDKNINGLYEHKFMGQPGLLCWVCSGSQDQHIGETVWEVPQAPGSSSLFKI